TPSPRPRDPGAHRSSPGARTSGARAARGEGHRPRGARFGRMMAEETGLRRLLALLHDSGFEHIVIGGTAAIAHGAATPTQDVEVAAPMTEENLERLLAALRPFHPKHATRPDLGRIPQSIRELTKFRLLLLDTDLGRLDVLGEVQ